MPFHHACTDITLTVYALEACSQDAATSRPCVGESSLRDAARRCSHDRVCCGAIAYRSGSCSASAHEVGYMYADLSRGHGFASHSPLWAAVVVILVLSAPAEGTRRLTRQVTAAVPGRTEDWPVSNAQASDRPVEESSLSALGFRRAQLTIWLIMQRNWPLAAASVARACAMAAGAPARVPCGQ